MLEDLLLDLIRLSGGAWEGDSASLIAILKPMVGEWTPEKLGWEMRDLTPGVILVEKVKTKTGIWWTIKRIIPDEVDLWEEPSPKTVTQDENRHPEPSPFEGEPSPEPRTVTENRHLLENRHLEPSPFGEPSPENRHLLAQNEEKGDGSTQNRHPEPSPFGEPSPRTVTFLENRHLEPSPETRTVTSGKGEKNRTIVDLFCEHETAKPTKSELSEEAVRFLQAVRKPGETVEIRCLPKSGKSVFSGWFDDMEAAGRRATAITGFKGTYFTLNPVRHALQPTIVQVSGNCTDDDVTHRSWLLVDIEGDRIDTKGNASAEEVACAIKAALEIAETVQEASPLVVMSGNGCHLLYRIDLPNDDESKALVKRALKGLAARYNGNGAKIDTTVFNAARISKLPGTLTRKGLHSDERPCRYARVLDWGVSGQLDADTLEEWVSYAQETAPQLTQGTPDDSWQCATEASERARLWIAKRDPAISGQNGDEWTFKTASTLVRGFSLSDSDALSLLSEWNRRCSPPWSLDELQDKLANARKYSDVPEGAMLSVRPPEKKVEKQVLESYLNGLNLTDCGNAEAIIHCYGKRFFWCTTHQVWYIWTGTHWKQDEANKILAWANKTARIKARAAHNIEDEDERKRALAFAIKSENTGSRQAALEQVKAFSTHILKATQLDRDRWALNTPNGTVNLRNGSIAPHKQADYITRCTDIPYDPNATCPIWEKYLDTCFQSNQDLIGYLQRAAGYSLTGDTSEHAVFIMHGGGNNGKSLFLKTLCRVIGTYAQPTQSTTFAEKPNEAINNALAALDGPRFVHASEINADFKLDEALIKSLSGEDTITARFLYKEFFQFEPQFKMWLATNHKPQIKGSDYGIWRRIKLIPWNYQIPADQIDLRLKDKFTAELPGILAWLVRGCLDWQKQGLQPPAEIKSAIAEYQMESDQVARFLLECCTTEHALRETPLSDLYTAYSAWSKEQGSKTPLGKISFRRKVQDKGFVVRESASKKRCWVSGIALESPSSDPDQTGYTHYVSSANDAAAIAGLDF